ncbi:High mobility group B protein 3 [Hibiscus syriacus]|uniref:High mobility group B protein 3 n=1 Tax=Hibiscus syriacus TaxID=106335 RepID=A0A6A2X748_HIBSY|nr:High mobility group B protein 3 [Hibiscus syriacus]
MKKAVAPNNPISLYSSSPQIPPSCSIRLVVFSAQRKIAGGSKSNPPKPRKRVDAASTASLVRARDGSAFAKWKKPSTTEPNAKKPKKLRRGKGPNAPKHPPTAFFLFMDDFRKSYKEANPDAKGVTGEGGEKWRSMYDEEKKCYIDKAAELKAEYEKAKKEEEEEASSDKEAPAAAAQKEAEVSDDY